MLESNFSEYSSVFLYFIVGLVFVSGGLFTSWIIRPNRPNEEKLTTYECGEDPIGSPWGRFNVRFYIVAILFLLFEVELVFLFPWAIVFGNEELIRQSDGLWAYLTLSEMFIFIGVLALGLAFAWVKGYLDWEKPIPETPSVQTNVPDNLYQRVNEKWS
ncbi:MAG: NADH-quinone oxidoreductase subunit A [Bacteroidota bacterium]